MNKVAGSYKTPFIDQDVMHLALHHMYPTWIQILTVLQIWIRIYATDPGLPWAGSDPALH